MTLESKSAFSSPSPLFAKRMAGEGRGEGEATIAPDPANSALHCTTPLTLTLSRPQNAGGEGKKRDFARQLRVNATDAEKLLWQKIRNRQIGGCKFHRQYPLDGYIVDFICFEKRLIIELDGGQHNDNEKDKTRDSHFSSAGFKIIRFWNNDVLGNIDGVLDTLEKELHA